MPGAVMERFVGSAADHHAKELPADDVARGWLFEVQRPALVLGSTQPDRVVDRQACARLGIEVVRRRSGGGAVLLEPAAGVWLDVVVPVSHQRWDADVARASHWIGVVWARTLERLGCAGVAVHLGGLQRTPWSQLVCFAGLAPGEVTVQGTKAVGISQRRTRAAARFQCHLPVRPGLTRLPDLLAGPLPARHLLGEHPTTLFDLAVHDVERVVVEELQRDLGGGM